MSRVALIRERISNAEGICMTNADPMSDGVRAPNEGYLFDTEPAKRVLERVLPRGRACQIQLIPVARSRFGDHYRVSGHDGAIIVEATSPAVLLTGVHNYLKRVVHVSITWNGDCLGKTPKLLPSPGLPILDEAIVPHRYVGNETWTGYTDAYWDFDTWRREIDILAMNGVNEILLLTGQISVYYETFKQFGYTDDELREWMPPPAHQPWFHLQSMHTIATVPKSVMDAQATLARQVADYMRSLGIVPVFPGYSGMVPPGFAERNPGALVIPQGDYASYQRVDQIDTTDDYYPRIAETFYEIQSQLFGDTLMYNMNILHESGNPGVTPVSKQAMEIQNALQRAHPGAIWVMLGWWHNPLRVVLSSLDIRNILIVDGMSDISRVDPDQEFGGAPYAFGSIWNFGGGTYMRGRLAAWVSKFHSWCAREHSKLSGIAVLPESNNTNPAGFSLMTELAWKSGPVDFAKWLGEFAVYRYGVRDPQAIRAWQGLGETVFSLEAPPLGPVCLERSDPFTSAPDVNKSIPCLHPTRYDPRFDEVLVDLLQVAPSVRDTSAYRYDLMDVARQVLANHAHDLHAELRASYKLGLLSEFAAASERWLSWIQLMDELLATNEQTLLGRYVENASNWGNDIEEKAASRYDALSIITIWAAKPGLGDYANRAWAGLTGGYYYDRWSIYLHEALEALKKKRKIADFDWHAWGDDWIRRDHMFTSRPTGDVMSIAARIYGQVSASRS